MTDRWPGLKAAYFQDPAARFEMAPDPSTKSTAERARRGSAASAASAASSRASVSSRVSSSGTGGRGRPSSDGASPAGPSLKRLAELEKMVSKANVELETANKKIAKHNDDMTKVQTKFRTARKTSNNRKQANEKLAVLWRRS